MKKKEITKERKVLLMPDQFEVTSLGDLMREVFERDFIEFCKERGIDPETIRHHEQNEKP